MQKTIIVGSRNSQLALTQTNYIIELLQKHFPATVFSVKPIKTEGDKILDVPLAKIGGKGLFVKEIEQALLSKEIDFAVHSMKDVPTVIVEGLTLAAMTERAEPRDCYIAKDGRTGLFESPQGAIIGTSSLRRSAQLLHLRPDLQIVPIRGNVNTRFRKLAETELDGIMLAYAGVYRLGWAERVTEIIDMEKSLPAVGQGALGIEVREDDKEILAMMATINDPNTYTAVTAERAFLRQLEGGCQVPIGAFCQLIGDELVLKGMVASLDGKTVLRDQIRGSFREASMLGNKLAEMLLERGAAELLLQARQEYDAHD
ncbi:MAG: hydroxymethylbilane synthase [Firmicutes bacterium]|nr:hydroxymethylbilane synthase [Bacillota bacterium]